MYVTRDRDTHHIKEKKKNEGRKKGKGGKETLKMYKMLLCYDIKTLSLSLLSDHDQSILASKIFMHIK